MRSNQDQMHVLTNLDIPRPADSRLKRRFDVAVAILLVLMLLPLLFLIACLVKLFDGGPIFQAHYAQTPDGWIFERYGFRTLRADWQQRWSSQISSRPEELAAFMTTGHIDENQYCTPVGRVLKQVGLDELPQLFNIILGDMSLVGPPAYPASRHQRSENLGAPMCRPGLIARDEVADATYAATWSFRSDLRIIVGALARQTTGPATLAKF
ncbi:sugar transferase [Rhizobium sp. BE258]|uniref:sugar transferase n=1 Tax=Rhizobium sp. BE258 TaxID=2817722 RepID=UPI0028644430|nr:sugar transferase [Rhizobium sp. BE258]MDR7145321.1 exopolysaccharide production protein ExoY [Rhizobium sp. BE258]